MCSKKRDLIPNRFRRSWIPVKGKLEIRYISLFFLSQSNRLNSTASSEEAPFSAARFCWPLPASEYRQPNSFASYPLWWGRRWWWREPIKNSKAFVSALTFARTPLEIRKAHLTINFHTRNDKNKLFFSVFVWWARKIKWTIDGQWMPMYSEWIRKKIVLFIKYDFCMISCIAIRC